MSKNNNKKSLYIAVIFTKTVFMCTNYKFIENAKKWAKQKIKGNPSEKVVPCVLGAQPKFDKGRVAVESFKNAKKSL